MIDYSIYSNRSIEMAYVDFDWEGLLVINNKRKLCSQIPSMLKIL